MYGHAITYSAQQRWLLFYMEMEFSVYIFNAMQWIKLENLSEENKFVI